VKAKLSDFTPKELAKMRALARKIIRSVEAHGHSIGAANNLCAIGCHVQTARLREEGQTHYALENVEGRPYGHEGFITSVESSGLLSPPTP